MFVGVIGLGIMGSAMAGNLLKSGYRVVGYDVVAARRSEHRRAGGVVAATAPGAAGRADIVICSLPAAVAVRAVAAELAATRRRGLLVVETSTLPLAVKHAARDRLAAAGSTLLDCPLSGTG